MKTKYFTFKRNRRIPHIGGLRLPLADFREKGIRNTEGNNLHFANVVTAINLDQFGFAKC
jgi:hypothetical protein